MIGAASTARRRAATLWALTRNALTEPPVPGRRPLISVILATYNWSSVLRHSVASVLWQTYPHFELLVVGDACTDDSEQVAASFGDDRVRWLNLEQNFGSQAGPNNRGLETARGEYIAYQGHDDVWHPKHLATLVWALETGGADLAHTAAEVMGAPGSRVRKLSALGAGANRPIGLWVPPCSLMHRREMAEIVGGWGNPKDLVEGVDTDFTDRVQRHRGRIELVPALTAFKFPSSARPNSYIEKPDHEQARYMRRIASERGFLLRELAALSLHALSPLPERQFSEWPSDPEPGELAAHAMRLRGLG
jgi:glycosyltransferase involved in cell wall biosynthesis